MLQAQQKEQQQPQQEILPKQQQQQQQQRGSQGRHGQGGKAGLSGFGWGAHAVLCIELQLGWAAKVGSKAAAQTVVKEYVLSVVAPG
jgi:hypothetical protein